MSGIFRSLTLTLSLVLPQVASSQEVIGHITATLNGEAREWQTLESTRAGESYNTHFRDLGPFSEISLHGYVEGGSFMRDVLVINLAMMQGDEILIDETVLYVEESMSRPWASLDGENLVTITKFDPETGVEGEIAGRLCFKEGMLIEPDTGNCIDIAGSFASRLPVGD